MKTVTGNISARFNIAVRRWRLGKGSAVCRKIRFPIDCIKGKRKNDLQKCKA